MIKLERNNSMYDTQILLRIQRSRQPLLKVVSIILNSILLLLDLSKEKVQKLAQEKKIRQTKTRINTKKNRRKGSIARNKKVETMKRLSHRQERDGEVNMMIMKRRNRRKTKRVKRRNIDAAGR